MVNISIDVTDLGGEARPGDKVVFWRPRMGGSATHAGRVISTAPVTVFLTDGKATVSDVEPGEMTVLLQCRGVESQGPVTVGVPDGDHTVTLRALLESQFEYAPPIVSAVQEAASNASASEEAAIQAQVRSEAAADRADAKVDDAINNGADLIRNEVKQDADRAVSARQAATQSESNAAASENAAASSASNAATSETNAKQSETNAGDYAAVATTAATEAVDAMESASDAASSIGDSVNAAAGHADRAEQYESGAAAYAQNASDAADRVGTAEQVGTWAQQAQDAADRIGTAETVEGWADSARDSASTAAQSETKAKEYRDAAFSAASSTADELRGDLSSIASEASRSASRAKTSETNAATHEANSLSAAERAEFAAEETIQQVEGDFATRNYVDAAKWVRGNVPASYTLEDLTEGSWGIASGTVARNLGIPEAVTGTITVASGNTAGLKTAQFISSTHVTALPLVFFNSTANSGGWGEWVNLSADFELPMKRAAVPLTFPRGSSYSDDRPTLTMRIPFKFGAAVKRARLRLRNYDYRSDHGFPGSYRIVGAGIGKHQINDDGSMTGLVPEGESITQLMPSTSMTGADEARGDWVEVNLEPNTDYLLSYSMTADDGMVYTRQTTQCWTNRLSSGWNRVGSVTSVPSGMGPLSAILDVEVPEETPIFGYLGDSQTAAISASRPGYDSWAMVHSRLAGAIPTIHGHAGAGLSEWQDSTKPAYGISDGMAKFDRMYISMGSNDIGNGRPYTGIQQYLTTAIQNWRKQTETFILHNYLPRTTPQESDTVRNALNEWIRSSLPGGALHTVDIWGATVDPATGLMDERWRGSNNDVHMTSAGNARVALATIGGVERKPVSGLLAAYNQGKGAQ